jgi:uncharacterized coiled-coil protein SlyX
MAQIKNNEVKFGINVGKPKIPTPSFNTKTTTPSMQGSPAIAGPKYGSQGLYNLGIQPKFSTAAPATTGVIGGGSNMGVGSNNVNTNTSNQVTPANPNQAMIDLLTEQMNGLQSQLDAKRSSGATPGPSSGPQNDPFAGVLSDLRNLSTSTKEQNRVRKEMEEVARGNRAIADNAARLSEQYGSEIARVGQLGAGAVAGNLSTGSNVVGSGNAAIASQSASQRINALVAGQTAALKGTEQQLTAQEQTLEGLNPSLNASLTQQQTGVTGLSNAGNLAQPVQVPYSNQFINPTTGQSAGGAGLGGYAGYNAAQTAIELAAQYPDAGVQYDANLSPEANLARIQQAITGSATYQRGAFGAAGANSYIGGQQLGAAGTLTQQVSQIQTLGAAADANFNLILDIAKRGKINDLNQPVLNQLAQGISRGLTSNEDVVSFRSGLQTVRSQYAAILGGGTPTDATQAMAAEKIPDTVSLAALQEVERTMKTMVNNTSAAYNQQISNYSNQGGGSGGGTWSW